MLKNEKISVLKNFSVKKSKNIGVKKFFLEEKYFFNNFFYYDFFGILDPLPAQHPYKKGLGLRSVHCRCARSARVRLHQGARSAKVRLLWGARSAKVRLLRGARSAMVRLLLVSQAIVKIRSTNISRKLSKIFFLFWKKSVLKNFSVKKCKKIGVKKFQC